MGSKSAASIQQMSSIVRLYSTNVAVFTLKNVKLDYCMPTAPHRCSKTT